MIQRVTPQADYTTIVSLEDAKAHLRVTHDDEDSLIESMIAAACREVEMYCPLWLGESQGYLFYDRFQQRVKIPLSSISAITAVQVHNGTDWEPLDAGDYEAAVEYTPPVVRVINSKTSPRQIAGYRIVFDAGYAANAVPAEIKQAILLHVGHMYEQRQPEVIGTVIAKSQLTIDNLLKFHRILNA
jgi:uncharacterized phiE125 gp8 family phage protein